MMTVMMRVSPETRDRVMKIAAEDFDGATADQALRRLIDEHRKAMCVEAMDRFREQDPEGWNEYLAEAEEWDRVSAPPLDGWPEEESETA